MVFLDNIVWRQGFDPSLDTNQGISLRLTKLLGSLTVELANNL